MASERAFPGGKTKAGFAVPMRGGQYSQDDIDRELLRTLTKVVREADESFEKEGGGTRHWVRDHFLPGLADAGIWLMPRPGPRRITTPHDDEIVQACVSSGGHFWADDQPGYCSRCWFHKDYPEGKIATDDDLRPVTDNPQA